MLLSLLALALAGLSAFFLQQNAINSDTQRMRSTLEKAIQSKNLDTKSDLIKILPKEDQSSAALAVKNGASFGRKITKHKITITEALYKNGQITAFVSLTERPSSIKGTMELMLATILILYSASVFFLVKRGKKTVNSLAEKKRHSMPTVSSYDYTEYFNFPIFVFDDHGIITFGNQAFRLKFPDHTTISQFSGQINFLNFLLQKMLNPESPSNQLIHFSTVSADYDVQIQALPEDKSRFLVMLSDVTVYQNTLQSQKELLANVSHELKTPLATIRGFAELLEYHPELAEEKRNEFLKIMTTESERLLELVTDLLALSKPSSAEKIQKENLNFKTIVEASLKNFQNEITQKKLNVQLSLEEISFPSNEKRLQIIFKNLIENAVLYTNLNGSITIQLYQHKQAVIFSITNTGDGLSEIEKSRIFERFYRAGDASRLNPKGTGLGLAIVRKNLQELGGKISVAGKENSDTIFQVTFL